MQKIKPHQNFNMASQKLSWMKVHMHINYKAMSLYKKKKDLYGLGWWWIQVHMHFGNNSNFLHKNKIGLLSVLLTDDSKHFGIILQFWHIILLTLWKIIFSRCNGNV